MRPSITRVTFRAASSLVSRNTARPAPTHRLTGGRACSSSAVSSDPALKHSSVSQASSKDALKSTSAHSTVPSQNGEHVLSPHSIPIDSSSSPNTETPETVIHPSTTTLKDDSESPKATETAIDSDSASVVSSISPSDDSISQDNNVDDLSSDLADNKFIPPGSTSEDLLSQIRSYLQRNAVRSALHHFISALKVDGAPAVDLSVLKVILPVLGRQGWAPSALDAVNLALEREYNLEVGLYNCGLHAMARSGDYNTVHEVINRMWSLPQESRPNATSYNYLIGSFMYRGAVDRAFEVLHEMKNHMIYPTFATYHALISGCLRSNDPRRAYTTLNAVERQRFDIGAMTISQVLVSCADADLTDEVMHLLPRLEEALPRYNNEVHRIAEKRQAYRISSAGTTMPKTTAEERALVRGSPRPEIGAISAILHCAFRNCSPELALEGWALLDKYYENIEIPATMWYCVIGAFAGSGDFTKAFEVLGVMRERGYNPRLKDLDIALIRPLSLEISKVDEQYYKLCDRMKGTAVENSEDEDVPKDPEAAAETVVGENGSDLPETLDIKDSANIAEHENVSSQDDTSDGSLREILAERTSSADARKHWKSMVPSSVGIDELNAIIAACSFAGDLDRAFQTYDEVETVFGLEKNIETFNALLEGCIQVKHVRGGLRIISEMEKVGMKLEKESLQLAVRLLTRASRAPECIDLLKKVRSEGGQVSLQTYLLLVRYFVRGDAMGRAVEVYEMGMEDGFDGRTLRGRLDSEGAAKLRGELPDNDMEEKIESGRDNDRQAAPVIEEDVDDIPNLEVKDSENELSGR